jgi:2-hydroxychromene-2-carboxylate isomerase
LRREANFLGIEYKMSQKMEGPVKSIDFWFSIGSTYSYLTIMRLSEVEKSTGIEFVWRPFSIRTIMAEMDNQPFLTKPVKAAYMWRDIERRATMYGLPAKLPAPYPLVDYEPANLVAVVGFKEGWCANYVQETYRRWFQDGDPAGSSTNLEASLLEIGQDPSRVLEAAKTPAIKQDFEEATDEARRLGIFGAPSFVVDGELFWGDDRLEDAINWRRQGRVSKKA